MINDKVGHSRWGIGSFWAVLVGSLGLWTFGCGGGDRTARSPEAHDATRQGETAGGAGVRDETRGTEYGAGAERGTEREQERDVARRQVTSHEVDAFSSSFVRLMLLQQFFQQRAVAGEPVEQLQREFDELARGVLEDEGLSPQRYDEIADQLPEDPELQQRVRQSIDEAIESELESMPTEDDLETTE